MADLLPKNRVGRFISAARFARSWSFGDLARACGAVTPRQVSRVSQQLVAVERDFSRHEGLLGEVVQALGLDRADLDGLLDEERRETVELEQKWLDEPVSPEVHFKAGPIWISRALPDSVKTEEDAVEFARRFSKGAEYPVALHWNRRVHYVFRRGELTASLINNKPVDPPHMVVGGKAFVFHVDSSGDARGQVLSEPPSAPNK